MRVAVFGGTGFVGRYVVDALHEAGYQISLLSRDAGEGDEQCRIVAGAIDDPDAIRATLDGCEAVIYLIGVLRENLRKGITFHAAQYDGVVSVADNARKFGISRFILMSANGAETRTTAYQTSKHDAERYVADAGFDLTVMRPSVMFGDPFDRIEIASQLLRDMVKPPIPAADFFTGLRPSSGRIAMSPAHIEDVAEAFAGMIERPETFGQTYAIGGPEALTWGEMISRVAAAVGKRKWLLPMPTFVVRIGATLFDWLSFFPVTRDQLTMLEQSNVCSPEPLRRLIGRDLRRFDVDELSYLTRR